MMLSRLYKLRVNDTVQADESQGLKKKGTLSSSRRASLGRYRGREGSSWRVTSRTSVGSSRRSAGGGGSRDAARRGAYQTLIGEDQRVMEEGYVSTNDPFYVFDETKEGEQKALRGEVTAERISPRGVHLIPEGFNLKTEVWEAL